MAQVAAKRVCLTGPESTGKSVLSEQLARELGAPWSAEYARQYAEACGNRLTAADVEPIARGEIVLLDAAIAAANDLVIHDTDLLSTVVYARHYYESCPVWIEKEARRRRADLYLLLDIDVTWVEDRARDCSADMREALLQAFRATLVELGCSWQIIRGDWNERRRDAAVAIARLRTARLR